VLFFLLFSVFPSLGQNRLVEEYAVRIEARNPAGTLVPATLTLTSESTGLSQRGVIRNVAFSTKLKAGIYSLEARHTGYRPVQKTLRLGRVSDVAQTEQTIILDMIPLNQAPSSVTVRVVDYETGRLITEGFDVRVEDITLGSPVRPTGVSAGSITFGAEPQHRFRMLVKASGYQSYRYEVEDSRLQNDVTIRLRRQAETKTYTIRVIDAEKQVPIPLSDVIVTSAYNQSIDLKRGGRGEWLVKLDDSTRYDLEVRAPGFKTYKMDVTRPSSPILLVGLTADPQAAQNAVVSSAVSPSTLPTGSPATEDAPAGPAIAVKPSKAVTTLATGKTVVLDNVFFDQSSYLLRPESYAQLNQLVDLLKSKPAMKVEISGHTDNVGDARLNVALSENRARVITNYLVSRGIPENRLAYRGLGSAQPLAPNDTEENRRRNRRVEVRVLEQ